jgi:hypothetical protein
MTTHLDSPHPNVPPPPGRKKIRWAWVVMGIVVAVFGLMITIGGALVSVASDTLASIDPDGEARTPASIEFVAERATYKVSLVGERETGSASLATNTTCQVRLANEQRLTVDGTVQAMATTSGNIASIGSFDAVPGPTTISCDAEGRPNMRYIVDRQSELDSAALWIVIGGVLLLCVGTCLILGGIFWRKPATR